MDRIHLPAIVKLRAPFDGGRGLAKKDITTDEAVTRTANRTRRKGVKADKSALSLDEDTAVTRKKNIGILGEKQRRLSTKFTVSGGMLKSTRSEGKHQNARRRSDATIGLPNISLSLGAGSSSTRNNGDAERTAAKKAKRCRMRHNGDTISYVYSKSLKDQNCMAFLRNCTELEKGVTSDQRSSGSVIDKKKPYGLPSLEANVECIDRWVTTGQGSHANSGESLVNSWDVDADTTSNATNFDSSDSVPDDE